MKGKLTSFMTSSDFFLNSSEFVSFRPSDEFVRKLTSLGKTLAAIEKMQEDCVCCYFRWIDQQRNYTIMLK